MNKVTNKHNVTNTDNQQHLVGSYWATYLTVA